MFSRDPPKHRAGSQPAPAGVVAPEQPARQLAAGVQPFDAPVRCRRDHLRGLRNDRRPAERERDAACDFDRGERRLN